MISANGVGGITSNSGGGSGGSIYIQASAIEGGGTLAVSGGRGNVNGGGGSGGRLAILWNDREWWNGNLEAFGGGSSSGRNGGPGTVYLQVVEPIVECTIVDIPSYDTFVGRFLLTNRRWSTLNYDIVDFCSYNTAVGW